MNKKKLFLFLILSIFIAGILSAQVSYCCERLESGAWCQNAPQEECDPDYQSVPTYCESTSYCKLGTCIDTEGGNCISNTPQNPCIDPNGDGDISDGGNWDERDKEDIPQCQLGCCLIGEQAAFTTLTRCKSLSSIYGLEIDYRTDVQNEIQCISMASPKTKGACVFEEEFQKNCKITTRAECQELDTGDNTVNFYENYLCSAESLETICGPRGGTTCVEGKDEVYFLDTCGNIANVYDSNRINDQLYWNTIMEPTCGDGAGNPDSPTCGDCDYVLGSTCKRAERGNSPSYGDHICKDLSCEYEGENYEHGETWCADAEGIEESFPGSRHFRLICYNNEVSVEPCADYRQEVCIESNIDGFRTAACRVNIWEDCYSQTNEQDCINEDKRDCRWVEGISILRDEDGQSLAVDENGEETEASCVPEFAPGFDFWEEGTDAEEMCPLASTICYVEYVAGISETISSEKGFPADMKALEKCKEEKCFAGGAIGEFIGDPLCNALCNAEDYPSQCVNRDGSLNEDWLDDMNEICNAIGDCGSSVNYVGQNSYYDPEDFVTRSSEEEEE